MPTASMLAPGPEMSGAAATVTSTRSSNLILLIPSLACAYALIVFPLLIVSCAPTDQQCLYESRPENRIVWPALAAITLIVYANRRAKLTIPPHLIWLFAYLGLAAASVTWAFNPGLSLIRFIQQAMIVASIAIPAMLAARSGDLMRKLFFCFAVCVLLNMYFVVVLGRAPITTEHATWGYPGYFAGKNYLGQCAGLAFVIALFEIVRRRGWRVSGAIVAAASLWLLYWSNSKTSLGLAVLAPILALSVLIARKAWRISPAVLPLAIISLYALAATVTNFQIGRLSYYISGEPTFTGRVFIWDFANYEISVKPLLGWGYQSFWLAGPGAPSLTDGPAWVVSWIRTMPNAHNGYIDTMLETGYVGMTILMMFIVSTLHAIGPVMDRDPARGWLLVTLAFIVMISNGLESTWMRGFEFMWIVFLFVAADVARQVQGAAVAASPQKLSPDLPPSGENERLGVTRIRLNRGNRPAREPLPAPLKKSTRLERRLNVRPVRSRAFGSVPLVASS